MNKISLSETINKNQPSWNDDPFDLKGEFDGVMTLSHEKNLFNFLDELVAHYAKYDTDRYELTLDMLPEFQKNELARLYIEYTDRDLTECVNGNDLSIDNEYTCAVLRVLKEDSQKNRDALSSIIRTNIISYYSESLQDLIDSSCEEYTHHVMNENGYYSRHDRDHGDLVWSKRS